MSRRRALVLVALATTAFGLAALWGLPLGGAGLRLYLVAIVAIMLTALLAEVTRAIPPAPPSAFEEALRRRRTATPDRPGTLVELESLLAGRLSAGDVHFRLRPVLREIASSRLQAAYGVDLDAAPEAARRLLSPEAWELVRPDREAPDDRFRPGLDIAGVRVVVDTLEALG